jgi:hypothetical protein
MDDDAKHDESRKKDKADLPRAIICDLDGTLALLGKRSPYDTARSSEDILNLPVANVIEVYAHQKTYDVRLILVSGREEKYRAVTEEWLAKHDIKNYEALHLRPSGDRRKDYVVKREIYESSIKNKYNVLFVLEDRDQVVKMWREINLTCFQVEYGDF